jgi:hypothetical protein
MALSLKLGMPTHGMWLCWVLRAVLAIPAFVPDSHRRRRHLPQFDRVRRCQRYAAFHRRQERVSRRAEYARDVVVR